jgi:hypothetical protein
MDQSWKTFNMGLNSSNSNIPKKKKKFFDINSN